MAIVVTVDKENLRGSDDRGARMAVAVGAFVAGRFIDEAVVGMPVPQPGRAPLPTIERSMAGAASASARSSRTRSALMAMAAAEPAPAAVIT